MTCAEVARSTGNSNAGEVTVMGETKVSIWAEFVAVMTQLTFEHAEAVGITLNPGVRVT